MIGQYQKYPLLLPMLCVVAPEVRTKSIDISYRYLSRRGIESDTGAAPIA